MFTARYGLSFWIFIFQANRGVLQNYNKLWVLRKTMKPVVKFAGPATFNGQSGTQKIFFSAI